ncbi:MAG: hypothetical protein ABGY75_10710 [Gemmataceae bacterium]
MPIEIETPLPGDTVPWTFHASGSADLRVLVIDPPDGSKRVPTSIASITITCELFASDNTSAPSIASRPTTLTATANPDIFDWVTTTPFSETQNREDCLIRATLAVTAVTDTEADSVHPVDIMQGAGGNVVIQTLP